MAGSTQSVLVLLAAFLASSGTTTAGDAPLGGRALEYPKDVRAFRAKALKVDGVFAPDIAFTLRTCPKCKKPYILGTFPRLKRVPFDSLAAVHRVVATNCLRKAPSPMMYSAKHGQMVPRACPACNEPEDEGRPDKVLFCHVLPESGDDMQIEYEVGNGQLVSRKFWRVPKGGEAAAVELADETEDSIKKAYGCHFSLRAVWNEIFDRGAREEMLAYREAKIVYRQVGPGMWFIFRPATVSGEALKEFAEKQIKADRDKGLFDRLDTPLVNDTNLSTAEGTYHEWAAAHESALSSGKAECVVAYSYAELHKAAREVLASHTIALEIARGEKRSDPGTGLLGKGDFKTEIKFAPLGAQAVFSGLSLHQACAFYLTMPMFTVEGADRLNSVLREHLAGCTFEVLENRYLVARDSRKQERKLDLLGLADKLDPSNAYMFGLFCSAVLPWDGVNDCFGPKLKDRDMAPTGLPAFVERRIRPAGHLKARGAPEALYEAREDREGRPFDLCYTSECSTAIIYVDPSKDRFKGMTLQEAQKLYDAMGGILPMYIDAQDTLSFPGDGTARNFRCRATLLCGLDLAALATDSGRAAGLAQAAQYLSDDERMHVYALATNEVVIAPRALTSEEMMLIRSRMKDLVEEKGLEPGLELGLHFDLPRVEPRGKVLRRGK
ncbi:MAG: hypothetical protein NTW87_18705 [Planctomycetota bacterium]|nr:hypothetical protein [Planctomycetota bacterium]